MPKNNLKGAELGVSEESAKGTGRAIRVFVVDDHPMVRISLRDMFSSTPGFDVCGEAGTCAEALEKIPAAGPDVVVLDLGLRGGNGFELLRDLRKTAPRAKALVFSMHEETKYALRALREGALGYVMKTARPEELIDAVRRAAKGERVIGDEVQQQLLRSAATGKEEKRPDQALSSREWQVFECLGRGMTMKETAERLGIGEKTVGSFCDRIKEKLDMPRLRDVAQYSQEWFRDEMP